MRRLPVASLFFFSSLAFANTARAQKRPLVARSNEAYVLIEGPKTATLELQDGATFRPVCSAPCDRAFPIGRTYRITGEDVHDSEPFELEGRAGSTVMLHVDDTKHHTGALVTQGGVLITLLGGLSFIGGVFGSCSESNLGGACSSYRWLTVAGGALAVAGVATIVTGIVLMAQGSHSQIEQKTGQNPAEAKAPQLESHVFLPALQGTKPLAPDAPTSPIFSFSF